MHGCYIVVGNGERGDKDGIGFTLFCMINSLMACSHHYILSYENMNPSSLTTSECRSSHLTICLHKIQMTYLQQAPSSCTA